MKLYYSPGACSLSAHIALKEAGRPVEAVMGSTKTHALADGLAGKSYLMGEQFSVADGYLFTVTNWAPRVGIDISGLANLGGLRVRVAARPAEQDAMRAEGLLQ